MRLPRIVKTADGSLTYFNEEFDQIYHSKSGAIEESFKKYVEPCELQDNMTILDYCFGLGYNTLAAIATCENITVYALEIDAKLLGNLTELTFTDLEGYEESLKKKLITYFKDMAEKLAKHISQNKREFTISVGSSTIHVLVGDAAHTIQKVPTESVDAIFWDPFSPKQHPQLWTQTEFEKAYLTLKPKGILATYSCARIVRDGLRGAGFEVKDGPIIGRRSPSTLGIKK